jgi:hypothetical protein
VAGVPGLRKGEDRVLVTQVEQYHRDGLRNGTGVAHNVYTQWRVDLGNAAPPPLPADETSATGCAVDDRTPTEGVYLVARKANVVLFIAYDPERDTVIPTLKRDRTLTTTGPARTA